MATASERLADLRAMCLSGEAQRIRHSAHVSLAEVGAEIGVTPTTVSRWETGHRQPRGPQALAFLDLLRRLERIVRRHEAEVAEGVV